MDINRAALNALNTAYNTAFAAGVQQGSEGFAQVQPFFTPFPSSTRSNFYGWLGKTRGFREWVGDRVYQNLQTEAFELVNKPWEDTIRLTRDELEDDQYGLYTPVIQAMGSDWMKLKREQVIAVLTENRSCWDGKALVADDHAYGANTVDNKTTSALDATSFEAALAAAAEWKYADGTLIKPMFTHLVVGPKKRVAAWNLLENSKVEVGSNGVALDNPNKGLMTLVVLPELAGDYDDYWFLLDCSRGHKPLALQVRREASPFMDTNPATIERTGYVDYLASGRLIAGPTFFDMVYGGIVS